MQERSEAELRATTGPSADFDEDCFRGARSVLGGGMPSPTTNVLTLFHLDFSRKEYSLGEIDSGFNLEHFNSRYFYLRDFDMPPDQITVNDLNQVAAVN